MSSSLSIISIKKNKLLIKKINGNISNNIDGVFKAVRNNGSKIALSLSLRKLISSNNVNKREKINQS